MSETYELKTIGLVRSDFPEKFGIPRQAGIVDALESAIIFEPEYRREEALRVLPERVRHFAARMGVLPASVRVTAARTRFGSCSAKNGLCFSLYLMQYPPEAVDYVVVHELSHILHKNHGPAFWACVAAVLPDYAARRALLLR